MHPQSSQHSSHLSLAQPEEPSALVAKPGLSGGNKMKALVDPVYTLSRVKENESETMNLS